MGKLKACTNESCIAAQKKTKYKEKDSYCSKCGRELLSVCKKCRTALSESDGAFCVECQKIKDEKFEKSFKTLGKAATCAGAATLIAVTAFPKLKKLSTLKKIIKKK